MADCPTHGVIAVNQGLLVISPGQSVNISSGSIQCPICGQSVSIIDGVYRVDRNGVQTSTLRPTPAQLRRLKTALSWATESLSGETVSEETVEKKVRKAVEREAPGLTSMVDKAFGTKGAGVAAWLAVMLAIIELLMGSSAPDITPEFIEQIVEQVQKDSESEQPTTPTPAVPKGPQRRHNPEEPVIVKTRL